MIKIHVLYPHHKYADNENEERIPSKKDNNVVMLIAYLQANFLYAGFATLTILVITVEHTIRVKIKFVMCVWIIYKTNFFRWIYCHLYLTTYYHFDMQ